MPCFNDCKAKKKKEVISNNENSIIPAIFDNSYAKLFKKKKLINK